MRSTQHRTLLALTALTAVVGLSTGCGGSGSNKGTENSDAGANDATSSSSGGGSGSGSGSGDSSSSSSGGGGDAGSAMPNCQPGGAGLTGCGASGTDSCCASPEVAGGTYDRTYTNSGSGPTGEADPASVSGFRLDKYLVTVGRFRQFVIAWNGGWLPPAGSGKHTHLDGGQGLANSASPGAHETGWVKSDDSNVAPTDANLACTGSYDTWTSMVGSQEYSPINCVNWWEAYAFCIWDGGFLPSEAEWEYAAAGGSQQQEYPWGSTDPGGDNPFAIYGCNYPTTMICDPAPVGTAALGAGLWGQLDLAGDVFEWTLDWDAPYVDPCTDCANLSSATAALPDRISRGGNFTGSESYLLPPTRNQNPPTYRSHDTGFRCARTP